jgi:hypothetical protein
MPGQPHRTQNKITRLFSLTYKKSAFVILSSVHITAHHHKKARPGLRGGLSGGKGLITSALSKASAG